MNRLALLTAAPLLALTACSSSTGEDTRSSQEDLGIPLNTLSNVHVAADASSVTIAYTRIIVEAADKAHDVARVIVVPVAVVRRARTAVPSCVGHDDVEFTLERARHRSPAGAAAHQSMEQNDTRFGVTASVPLGDSGEVPSLDKHLRRHNIQPDG